MTFNSGIPRDDDLLWWYDPRSWNRRDIVMTREFIQQSRFIERTSFRDLLFGANEYRIIAKGPYPDTYRLRWLNPTRCPF